MSNRVLEEVCRIQQQARPLFVINLTLFVILLLVFPFVDRGSATFVISVFGLVIIGGTLLVWGGLMYKCKQFAEAQSGFLEREK